MATAILRPARPGATAALHEGLGMSGGRYRSEGTQDAAAQTVHARRVGQVYERRRQAGVDPPEAEAQDTVGIGTEATRANIIGGLIARGYLVKEGRAIRASDAAFTLIDAVPAAIADLAPPPSGNKRST